MPPLTVTKIVTDWLPFDLGRTDQHAVALLTAATDAGLDVRPKVAGPSNIGNRLAGLGIRGDRGIRVVLSGPAWH